MTQPISRRETLAALSALGVLTWVGGCSSDSPKPAPTATTGTSTSAMPSTSTAPATPTTTSTSTTSTSAAPSSAAAAPPGGGTPLDPGHVNVLVIGTDSRQNAFNGSSDVITLVQLTGDRKRINLVSVARDTAVSLPNGSRGKINSAYAMAGPSGLARTVTALLGGLPIHYTLETAFLRFIEITNILGGVTVQNRNASSSSGVAFPRGPITLQGEKALVYVRERKGLPNGDLDRTERHRAMLTGMLARLHDMANSNPADLTRVLSGVYKQVRSSGITMDLATGLLPLLKTLSAADVTSVMVPITGFGTIGGASVDIVNQSRTAELAQALRAGDLSGYVGRYGTSNAPTR